MMGHRAVKLIALLTLLAPIAQSATWKTLDAAGYHRPREETTLAACGGTSLCLLGGRNRVPTPVLDTATLKWTEGPAPPIELHHFQGVRGPDGCAWVLGAWTGKFPGETAVDTIFRYCVADAVWQQVGTIARPRGAGGVAFHNGLFYLVTGNVGGHQKSAKLVPWFDAYNPKTKTWTQLPDIPNARDHVNVVVANNKLYVAGGRDSSDSYPKFFSLVETNVDVYDFMTGAWSTLPSGFPRGRAGAPAISYRGVPWVAGGEGSGRAWTEVDALSGNAFVPGPAMLHPRHGFGMYECNNVIWVAGGAGVQGGGAPQMKLDAYFDGVNPVPCTFSASTTITPKPSSITVKTPSTEAIVEPESGSSGPAVSSPTDASASAGSTPNQAETPVNSEAPGTKGPSASTPNGDSNAVGDKEISPNSAKEISSTTEAPKNENTCFPGHATVQMEGGYEKRMEDLQIGDRVLVSHPDTYSEVYFFSHAHAEHVGNFVNIRTELDDVALQVSSRHLVYANGEVVEAQHVAKGDQLFIAHDRRLISVTSVEQVSSKGLYNPHTLHGDIIVNRVVATTYTRTLHPRIARILLHPFHAAYRIAGPHPVIHAVNRGVLRLLENVVW